MSAYDEEETEEERRELTGSLHRAESHVLAQNLVTHQKNLSSIMNNLPDLKEYEDKGKRSGLSEFWILLKRENMNFFRNKKAFRTKLVRSVITVFLLCATFYRLTTDNDRGF